jgi:outer membrane murein-binding lipoprotein Lpp
MRARLTPAALLVVCLVLAGCGGSGRKEAISAYIDQVNAVQTRMAKPLQDVSRANRDFAAGKKDPAVVRDHLTRSEQTMKTLRRRLERVRPPADAKKLHALLLELIGREVALTHEVAQMAVFIPAFSLALEPAAPAGKRLKSELNVKGKVAEKAAALEAYRDALGGVLARLRPLHPPPSSEPVFASQVQTLTEVRSAVADLALALREKRNADIGPLLHRFDVAAVGNQTVAAQKAQIAAVRAYNARLHGLDTLTLAIAKERSRLQKLG